MFCVVDLFKARRDLHDGRIVTNARVGPSVDGFIFPVFDLYRDGRSYRVRVLLAVISDRSITHSANIQSTCRNANDSIWNDDFRLFGLSISRVMFTTSCISPTPLTNRVSTDCDNDADQHADYPDGRDHVRRYSRSTRS